MRLRRDERGVTVVEAAFVIPLLFLFIFALIDIGLWVFETSQASSAARDGARAGIVLKLAGTTSASGVAANETAIRDAVKARLSEDRITSDNQIDITCLSTTNVTIDCDDVIDGTSRLRVEVEWDRSFLTFVGGVFGGKQTITGKATMVVVGRPAQG